MLAGTVGLELVCLGVITRVVQQPITYPELLLTTSVIPTAPAQSPEPTLHSLKFEYFCVFFSVWDKQLEIQKSLLRNYSTVAKPCIWAHHSFTSFSSQGEFGTQHAGPGISHRSHCSHTHFSHWSTWLVLSSRLPWVPLHLLGCKRASEGEMLKAETKR